MWLMQLAVLFKAHKGLQYRFFFLAAADVKCASSCFFGHQKVNLFGVILFWEVISSFWGFFQVGWGLGEVAIRAGCNLVPSFCVFIWYICSYKNRFCWALINYGLSQKFKLLGNDKFNPLVIILTRFLTCEHVRILIF